MADVTLQIRKNGGSVQTGAVAAAVGDTIQLTAANKTGWNVSTVRWEIFDYPPDFTVPAGWSADADGIFYVLGSADPPSFVLDEWGKYLTRVVAANHTDERTIVDIASPSGLKDMMRREGAQIGGNRLGHVADQKRNLRTIESIATGAHIPSVTFTPVLTVDRNKRMTAVATLTKCIIACAPSGHVPGTSVLIDIPANTVADAIDLQIAPEFSTDDHPVFTPTDPWVLIVTCISSTRFVSSLIKAEAHDSTAPTLTSATVNVGANPNGLVLVFSSAVYLPDLTGVSLSFSAGTARTITAIESVSDDLTTWTLTLSGNFDGSETCSLVRASTRTWQDLNGNLIAAGSTAVTVTGTWSTGDLTGLVLWIDPGQGHATSEGAGVSSVTNQGSLGGTFTQGTGASQPIYNANGFGTGLPWFNFDGTDDSLASTITFDNLTTDAGEWYFGCVVTVDSIGTNAANDANDTIMCESAGYWNAMFRSSNGFNGYVWDGGAKLNPVAIGATPVGPILLEFRSTGGNTYVRVNKGAEVSLAAGDVALVAGTLRIGADRTPANFADFKLGELWFTDGDPGATERNNQADAMIAKYGI